MPRLLLATNNSHKLAELCRLLTGCGWDLVSPAQIGFRLPEEETGGSYEANARTKALNGSSSGLPSLADDSGLEIDALPGELGYLSARFAGAEATYPERFRIILERLSGLKGAERRARFRCVIAVADREKVWLAEGVTEGFIAEEPRGTGGFGYDPIFWLPAHSATVAELPSPEKDAISHRGRAVRKARATLERLLKEQTPRR